MFKINENYQKLPGSYLFSTIAKKVAAFTEANPDKELIRLGIGDVTQPLAPAVIEAMHKAVDEMGNIIDGDQIMAIVGVHMKNQGKLKDNKIIATVMSNLGFFLMGDKNDIKIEQTKVGDRYVLERMKEIGASLGGEQSGHIIFLDENTTGDGLLSALHLLQVMVETEEPLSELSKVMEVMPQALVNAKVPNHKKERYMEYPEIAEAISRLDSKFAGEGRVLIRPSGTEPKVRVMIEGKDKKQIDEEAKKLAELIQNIML